ncbi:MAG: molybdopterin-dependent oxidoreductase [Pseudomonadales bacterium]|jgi:CO/xanthine dehydrogenase Mo-binding subunit|nr:molybdopterin-dependent oxidoreductase [Pseudomonadales bacterium]
MVQLNRRKFLFATGWVAGGATLLYTLRNHALAVAPTIIIPDEESGAAWVQIQPDGSCRMFFPRIDMGQNANTGLAQIVAEELNLKVEEIDAVAPNTSDVPPLAVTAGSMSLTAFSRPIATAAATLREHLRERAALKLSQPIAATLDEVGGFRTANNRRVHYADLVDAATTLVEFDESKPAPTLYTFDSKRTKRQVGHSVKPLGIRELVTGAPVYTADIPFDGVLFGRAVLPPVRNASIASLNTSGVSAVKGFIKLVQEGDFVGVVCKTPSAVDAAMAQIDVTWHLQEPLNQNEIDRLVDVDAKMAEGDLEHILQDQAHRIDADWAIDLRFDVQVQTHAAQEPRAAVARFNDKGAKHKLEIWTGNQDPWGMKRFAAMDTGLAEDEVVIYPQRLGGGFGGREHYEVERDAVRLARAVKQTVKVQWTRKDEFTASRSRPASAHRLRIAADEAGNLTDWWHGYVSGHVVLARERLPSWLLSVARLGEDMGVVKGGVSPYNAPHQRVECSDVDLPIDLGVWRSLNGAPAIFAIESAMDELAIQQRLDPVDFKIKQMAEAHPRLQHCLERVRSISAKQALPLGEGYGRGFASGIYEGRCFVAISADVYVDPETEQIKVLHMCCAQDVGMAVNPGQLRAQIESNLVWSIGMALFERFEVADNDIQSSNFDNYAIVRMSDMPSLDIEVIDRSEIAPTGAGETALIAGPPAIANAIRNASGFRPLSLPISFSDIR